MEQAALERCLEELHPDSFGWALACCRRDFDDAEEVLQIAYLKIVEGRARFDGRSSLKTWLFGVIRRTALERFRWKRARQRLLSMFRIEPAAGIGEDERIERSETAQQLLRALQQLPSRQREVLELVFYHDLTIEQSAETLGISLGSARVHYARGKKRILQLMSEEGRVAFA
jgi:RNA polymerase sigma-70 factor (ECF subfamily)